MKNILTKVLSGLPKLGESKLWTEIAGTKQEAACNEHHCVHPSAQDHEEPDPSLWGWRQHPNSPTLPRVPTNGEHFLPRPICSPPGALRANFVIWWLGLGSQWFSPRIELGDGTILDSQKNLTLHPEEKGELFDLSGGQKVGWAVGGRNGWMERQVPRLAASLSCFSLPTSSSAISRGRRKVISDLTPKSQLLVAAPRSGMSAAPSQSSGSLTLSFPGALGLAAAAPLTPEPGAARLLGAAPWIPPEDYKRARLQGAESLGQGPASPEHCQEPEEEPELAERREMFGSC